MEPSLSPGDPSLTSPGGSGNKVPSVDLSSNQELCGGVARCQDYGHGQLPAEIISTIPSKQGLNNLPSSMG